MLPEGQAKPAGDAVPAEQVGPLEVEPVHGTLVDLLGGLSQFERDAVFGSTAAKFYHL